MIIKSVELVNFRSHKNYKLKCNKKTTLIVGENGSGKTSILEAIFLAMRGKSFRANDAEMLKRGEEFYRVELVYNSGEKTVVGYDEVKRRFKVGDEKKIRLPKKNKYPTVLFVPDDLYLISSSPTRRRDYFDRLWSDLDERYGSLLSRYNKILKQRNELLKEGNRRELFTWNILMAKYGFEIGKWREKLIGELSEVMTETYRSIAENKDEVNVRYIKQGEVKNENEFLREIEKSLEKDLILGYTSYGIHRDKYDFVFNGTMADGSASRGEVRSIILAMKFIEAKMMMRYLNQRPIVLLDDVFSELDEMRQKALVKNFQDNQVFITSVDEV